ncbi:MAG: hypothetical protein GC190_03130 [Alphaproteobacteria bacterium]|nr:hypothetical protein [Alphaproteobacteria bacterium]
MFVGHYAPAFAAKAIKNSPGLAAGLLAVQAVDIGFFTLTYFDIEKWRPNPDLPGMRKIDLYYMPYTHSLVGCLIWAAVLGAVAFALSPQGRKAIAGIVIAGLVFSHWLLDLIVHRPDLALYDDHDKMGFGLWNYPTVEMPLEIGILLIGWAIYLYASKAKGWFGHVTPFVVLAALLGLQYIDWFMPVSGDHTQFTMLALVAYFGVGALGLLLDRTREAR